MNKLTVLSAILATGLGIVACDGPERAGEEEGLGISSSASGAPSRGDEGAANDAQRAPKDAEKDGNTK